MGGYSSHKSSEEVLNELLTLPQPPSTSSGQPKRKAVNDKALEITDDNVLREMKENEHAAAEAIKKKEENKVERECRAKERLEEKERRYETWTIIDIVVTSSQLAYITSAP